MKAQARKTRPAPVFPVIMVGAIPFVSPVARERLEPSTVEALTFAEAMAGKGMEVEAQALIHGLQRQLGVSASDHVFALDAEAERVAEAHRAAQRRKAASDVARVRRLAPEQPLAQPTREELKMLAEADRLAPVIKDRRGNACIGGSQRDQARARAIRREVAAAIQARTLGCAVEASIEESLQLRGLRSGTAEKLDKLVEAPGYKRVRNDDGLALISLDDTGEDYGLRQAGFRYRDLYRANSPTWKSQLDVREGGRGSGNTDAMVWAGIAMAKRRRVLTEVELRVTAMGEGVLHVVRAVAGEGQTLRQYAPGEAERKAASAALKLGLRALHRLFSGLP
jgi:hypothetical protein